MTNKTLFWNKNVYVVKIYLFYDAYESFCPTISKDLQIHFNPSQNVFLIFMQNDSVMVSNYQLTGSRRFIYGKAEKYLLQSRIFHSYLKYFKYPWAIKNNWNSLFPNSYLIESTEKCWSILISRSYYIIDRKQQLWLGVLKKIISDSAPTILIFHIYTKCT